MSERILREQEVQKRTSLSKSTRWRMEQEGLFPKRRKITSHAVGWLESEIVSFIKNPEAWILKNDQGEAA